MRVIKPLGRMILTLLAAVFVAAGFAAAVICAAGLWVGTAVKVGWRDGWKGVRRGAAR